MKISIHDVFGSPEGRIALSFNEKLEMAESAKPVVGELTLTRSASGVRVKGKLTTLLKLSCDRCLRPYFLSLVVDVDEQFVNQYEDEESPPADRELLKDDFVEPVPRDGILDISDIVSQSVTLAIPTVRLCGSECPGFPGSVKNSASADSQNEGGQESKPLDPRWKNLKSLFPKEETK